ncbi:MAG: hypothetical protein ACR2GK_03930 [Gemmatimonadaceae bacterium]
MIERNDIIDTDQFHLAVLLWLVHDKFRTQELDGGINPARIQVMESLRPRAIGRNRASRGILVRVTSVPGNLDVVKTGSHVPHLRNCLMLRRSQLPSAPGVHRMHVGRTGNYGRIGTGGTGREQCDCSDG